MHILHTMIKEKTLRNFFLSRVIFVIINDFSLPKIHFLQLEKSSGKNIVGKVITCSIPMVLFGENPINSLTFKRLIKSSKQVHSSYKTLIQVIDL